MTTSAPTTTVAGPAPRLHPAAAPPTLTNGEGAHGLDVTVATSRRPLLHRRTSRAPVLLATTLGPCPTRRGLPIPAPRPTKLGRSMAAALPLPAVPHTARAAKVVPAAASRR